MYETFVMGDKWDAGKSLILQEKTEENFIEVIDENWHGVCCLYSHLIYVLEWHG